MESDDRSLRSSPAVQMASRVLTRRVDNLVEMAEDPTATRDGARLNESNWRRTKSYNEAYHQPCGPYAAVCPYRHSLRRRLVLSTAHRRSEILQLVVSRRARCFF